MEPEKAKSSATYPLSKCFWKNNISVVTLVPAMALKAESGSRTPPRNSVVSRISCKMFSVRLSIVPVEEIIATCPPS